MLQGVFIIMIINPPSHALVWELLSFVRGTNGCVCTMWASTTHKTVQLDCVPFLFWVL